MAIQNRRGSFADLDTNKLLPGEYAVVLADDPFCKNGKAVYICFNPGNTKRMATYEDMQEYIDQITQDVVDKLTEEINEVIIVANNTIIETKAAGDFANNVAEDLIARREAGEFNGPEGTPGVVTTTKGQFAFQVEDGDLYYIYTDGDDEVPRFTIDSEGNMWQTIGN